MMSRRILSIARIGGVEIRVHISWVLVLAVVTVGAAAQPSAFPADWPLVARLVAGGVLAGLFLGSIIGHELAHAIVARRRGFPVEAITIVFFGGLTSVEDSAARPADEAAIALAGPAASLGIGLPATAVGVALGPESSVVGLWLAVAGSANVLLGLLNLVPALPLDGGRVIHAALWAAAGDAALASRRTARLGRLIGATAIAAGVLVSLIADAWTGLVILISGWFVIKGSQVTERRLEIERLLRGVRVDEVMERDVPSVGPTLTIDTFAGRLIDGGEQTSLAVVNDGDVVGVVGIDQLRRVARARWSVLRAADVMVAPPDLPRLAADDAAWAAMELLRRTGLDGIPVMAGSSLLGLFTRRAVVAVIRDRATGTAR